jgi:thiol-disulfide isomerase/thioredoxin
VTILDFFAVNCGYCKKQIPRLETVRRQYAGKPVRFITVAETMRKRPTDAEVKAKIDEIGMNPFKGL